MENQETLKQAKEEIKEQQFRIYEPDFDNIKTLEQVCELLKSLHITSTYDLNDGWQNLEVNQLINKGIIKEVEAQLTNTNN